jgi:hypothetical protein
VILSFKLNLFSLFPQEHLKKIVIKNMGRAFGTVAMIFGSISIPLCVAITALSSISSFYSLLLGMPDILALFSILGWLIPTIAIIFGIIGIIKDDSKGLAIAGLILGVIALILGLIIRYMITSLFSGLMP